MINAILSTLPREDNVLRAELKAIFPWLPEADVIAALSRVAVQAAPGGEWRKK
jgi:hypothetical protein